MKLIMGKNQANGICLITLLLLSFVWGGTIDASPDPVSRSQPTRLVARTETERSANNLDGGYHTPDMPSSQTEVQRSKWTGKWFSALPSQLGFNPDELDTAVDKIGQMEGIYSLLLVRNGCLVVERYFREGHRTKPHNLKSVAKSVLSALIGIAIDEGRLSLDQPINELLPQSKDLNDPRKADITVRHLLTMTSGLKPTSYQAYNAWVLKGDWVKTALDQPLVADPGTSFQYSTGNTHILSAVLTAATGMSTQEFAIRKLFDPMNIKVQGWDTDPKGIYQGGNNLSLIPRDMAKIGQLYLDGGKFGDRQLVPKWWVDASTRAGHSISHEVYGTYGYLWYLRPGGEDAFVAVGYGGQYIYVSPAYNCVVVVTSILESKGLVWEKQLFKIIHNGIFGNIQTDQQQLLQVAGLNVSSSEAGRPALPAAEALVQPIVQTTAGMGQAVARINLRRGPGQTYSVIITLDVDTALEIKEQTGSWLRVQTGNLNGWVSAKYVRLIPPKAIAVAKRQAEVTSAVKQNVAPKQAQKPVTSSIKIVQPEGQLKELQDLVEHLRSRLHASEKAQQQMVGEVNTIRKDRRTQREAVALSETARKALESELSGLHIRIAELGDTLKTMQTTRENLNAELTTLRHEVAAQREIADRSESAKRVVEIELASTRDHIKELRKAMTKVRKELQAQRQVAAQTEDIRKKLVSELASAQQQVGFMQKALQDSQKAHENNIAELDSLHFELENQRKATMNLESTQTVLVAELAKARKQISALETSFKASSKITLKRLPDLEAIDPFVRSWAEAWERKDVEAYLSHYSREFRPPGGISLAVWYKQRHKRLLKPAFIKIEIDNIQKNMTGTSRAQVTFNQMYKSNVYVDQVVKTLDLWGENGGWKILKETIKAR